MPGATSIEALHATKTRIRSTIRRLMRMYDVGAGELAGELGVTRSDGDRDPHAGVRPHWVGQRWTEIAYRAGVKLRPRDGVGSHSARHTAAKDVFEQTKDALAVMELLRHASLATTDVYLRRLVSAERLRPLVEGRHYGARTTAEAEVRPD